MPRALDHYQGRNRSSPLTSDVKNHPVLARVSTTNLPPELRRLFLRLPPYRLGHHSVHRPCGPLQLHMENRTQHHNPTRHQHPADQQMRRAITYSRVSTTTQATDGLSLDDQADQLAREVKRRGWLHVAHITDPGLSGRKMTNRPGLQEALTRLDAGEADVLIAAKLDRLSRSTADFAQLLDRAERGGWAVIVLDVDVDTSHEVGRLVVTIVSAAAEFESRRIGSRIRDAHAHRKSLGQRSGPKPTLAESTRQRIASERAGGRSLQVIADDLNREGIPGGHGGRWHRSTVAHVLRSVALDNELADIREAASSH